MQEVSPQILADEQPQMIEVTLSEFDELVLDKKALDRLIENPDFNRIIIGKYFALESDRLVGLIKSTNTAAIRDRATIVEKLAGIGYMEAFLRQLGTSLTGIDNPEQRLELLRQIDEFNKQEIETVEGV
ncbi:MAG: hypothetical protein DRQ78_04600 [Epsilonproteobacteria bacterium]|nr:MAG: hypothetical protein DRQ78_04600 [Campylobacterota bacterium]